MARPVQHRPSTLQWQGPGLAYRIEGTLAPVLHLSVDGFLPVYFEHHVVLWKDPSVTIGPHKTRRGYRRELAGMAITMAETQSGGDIALSRDSAGQIISMHLMGGMSVNVRQHQFLAATATLDHQFERMRGQDALFAGESGYAVDRFDAFQDGVLWLHGYGDVFHVELDPGEAIDIEPAAWIYYETGVTMEQETVPLKPGLLSGASPIVFNRFTGPGRVGLQSLYKYVPDPEA